jgi:hypothetical protein
VIGGAERERTNRRADDYSRVIRAQLEHTVTVVGAEHGLLRGHHRARLGSFCSPWRMQRPRGEKRNSPERARKNKNKACL